MAFGTLSKQILSAVILALLILILILVVFLGVLLGFVLVVLLILVLILIIHYSTAFSQQIFEGFRGGNLHNHCNPSDA